MPTAAKLVGGLCLAITAAIAAMVFIDNYTGVYQVGFRFIAGNAIVGFFAGWYALGKNPGYGIFVAAANGVRALVFLLIGAGMLFASVFVLGNLERNNFNDPVDLPLLWIQTSFDFVVLAFTGPVLLTLLIGGVVSGLITYIASRRWS